MAGAWNSLFFFFFFLFLNNKKIIIANRSGERDRQVLDSHQSRFRSDQWIRSLSVIITLHKHRYTISNVFFAQTLTFSSLGSSSSSSSITAYICEAKIIWINKSTRYLQLERASGRAGRAEGEKEESARLIVVIEISFELKFLHINHILITATVSSASLQSSKDLSNWDDEEEEVENGDPWQITAALVLPLNSTWAQLWLNSTQLNSTRLEHVLTIQTSSTLA